MIHIITYDLKKAGQDYDAVHNKIESFADFSIHAEGSVWFVDTLIDPSDWRDALGTVTDTNDEIIVSRQHARTWATSNSKRVAGWLNDQSRRW